MKRETIIERLRDTGERILASGGPGFEVYGERAVVFGALLLDAAKELESPPKSGASESPRCALEGFPLCGKCGHRIECEGCDDLPPKPGGSETQLRTCHMCYGSGKRSNYSADCRVCGGTGKLPPKPGGEIVVVDEGRPGGDKSVRVTAHRADGGALVIDSIEELMHTVAGVPCRFCMGRGNSEGRCPDCGKPRGE